MSKIEITSSNIDKFVKRFHKVTDAKNNGKKLSESQEIFAQSLGCSNYNELKKLLNKADVKPKELKTTPVTSDLLKGFEIAISEDSNVSDFIIKLREVNKTSQLNLVEKFYKKLLTILHHPESKISSCFFEKDKFDYKLEFNTCYGDKYVYTFGADYLSKRQYSSLKIHLKNIGFSKIDIELLSIILDEHKDNEVDLTNRYEAIDFANTLYKYLSEIRGKKRIYVMKLNENDTINYEYVYQHDLLYIKRSSYVPLTHWNDFIKLVIDHEDKNYVRIKDPCYLINIRHDWHPENRRIDYFECKSKIDCVVKKTEIYD